MKKKQDPFFKALKNRAKRGDIEEHVFESQLLGTFKPAGDKPNKKRMQEFEVGQTVELTGTHPAKGRKGEIVSFENLGTFGVRPKVRIFDMCDHEVFIMHDSDARILK